MKDHHKDEYVRYRLEKADETLQAARLLFQNNFYNSSVSRLYYACFYATNALLTQNGINAQTHSGVKTQLFLNFVKSDQLSTNSGKLYAKLFTARQRGDYNDFYDFDRETVEPLLSQSEEFIKEVKSLIKT